MTYIYLETDRFVLRPLEITDFEKCLKTRYSSELSNDEINGDNLAISNFEFENFEAMLSYRNFKMSEKFGFDLGVFSKLNSEFIGEAMLYDFKGDKMDISSIGLILYSPYRGYGYSKEILNSVVQFAFNKLGVKKIEGQAKQTNKISIKMCLSIGFKIVTQEERMVILEMKKSVS